MRLKQFFTLFFVLVALAVHAQDILISQGGTVNTCGGTLYDSGGPGGNYADGENSIITLCADDPVDCLSLNFTSYDLEQGFDEVIIYNGNSIFSPILGSLSGNGVNASFTGTGGCLTIQMVSDFVVNFSGFQASISCTTCPTCDDGIMNGLENGVDCGGECPPCPCADLEIPALPFAWSGSTCGAGNSFSWDDVCGNFSISGQDITFSYTAEEDGCIEFAATDMPMQWNGLIVTTGCPDDFTSACVSSLTDFNTGTMSGIVIAEAGQTYFFTVGSENIGAGCMDFSFSLSEGCPPLTPADCLGAVPVCQDVYTETSGPIGSGFFPNEIGPAGCNFSETNSIWYTFTVQEAGLLSFIIEPNNNNDDYDWALYNITDAGCADIPFDQSMEVSCNSWGAIGVNGPTGISTANGGTGNSNGPGDLNGPPFNADLPVAVGETYALVVMNWSNSFQGYDLNFTGSTASIFDQVPPEITDVEVNCSASDIVVSFSEPVSCETLIPENFNLNGPNGVVVISSVSSPDCEIGAQLGSSAILSFDAPLQPGDYVLDGLDGVEDACSNLIVGTFSFTASDLFTVNPIVSNACAPGEGEIDASDVEGGLAPFSFTLNGNTQNNGLFENLNAGSYTLVVEDAGNCEIELELEVLIEELEISLGADAEICVLDTVLEAVFSGGILSWSGPPEISFGNPASDLTTVSASEPGSYTITATVSTDLCESSATQTISFSEPINFEFVTENITCHDWCDGWIEISSSPADLSYSINGGASFVTTTLFEGLCAGNYNLVVRDEQGCAVSGELSLSQPPLVVAGFDADPQPTSVPFTTLQFENLSQNYISSQWYFGEGLGGSTEEHPEFTFPQDQGGLYPVALVVENANGCQDSLVRYVLINNEFQVFVPNAFSPNGDGTNEVFLPRFSSEPEVYELKVFDRWGELVFSSTDYTEPWLGNVDGGDHFVHPGVFVWMLRAGRNEIETSDYQGHVTVIR